MAIYYGQNLRYAALMVVNMAEAKNRLPELVRAVEAGEEVLITRDGKPVAQLNAPPPEARKVQWGAMKDRIVLLPGWDDPIDRILIAQAIAEGLTLVTTDAEIARYASAKLSVIT